MMTESVEILKGNGQFFILKVLNFFSSRPFSFIIFVGGEGSTNSFLGLLDSLSRNVKVF
jgi:hypothetical protein